MFNLVPAFSLAHDEIRNNTKQIKENIIHKNIGFIFYESKIDRYKNVLYKHFIKSEKYQGQLKEFIDGSLDLNVESKNHVNSFLDVVKDMCTVLLWNAPSLLVKDKILANTALSLIKIIGAEEALLDGKGDKYYFGSIDQNIIGIFILHGKSVDVQIENVTKKGLVNWGLEPHEEFVYFSDVIKAALKWFKEPNAVYQRDLVYSRLYQQKKENVDEMLFLISKEFDRLQRYFLKTSSFNQHEIDKYEKKIIIYAKEVQEIKELADKRKYGKKIRITLDKKKSIAKLIAMEMAERKNSSADHKKFSMAFSGLTLPDIGSLYRYHRTGDKSIGFVPNRIGEYNSDHRSGYLLERYLHYYKGALTIDDLNQYKYPDVYSKETYIVMLRKLSPKRLPDSLKKLIRKGIYVSLMSNENDLNKGHIEEMTIMLVEALFNANVTVKAISAFLGKFFDPTRYVEIGSKYTDKQIVFMKRTEHHDAMYFLLNFSRRILIFHTEIGDKNFGYTLKKLLIILSAYNIDKESLSSASSLTENIFESIKTLRALYGKEFSSASHVYKILTDLQMQELHALKCHIEDKGIVVDDLSTLYAANKKMVPSMLRMLEKIGDSPDRMERYTEKSFIDAPVEIKTKEYIVGIYPHNHPVGIVGALASGVCIQPFGSERMTHLNSNFLNLCIHSERRGIQLWGLIVLATDKYGKKHFVLNNLQGSVYSDAAQIANEIRKVFQSFVDDEVVGSVITNDVGFNAVSLMERDGSMVFENRSNICIDELDVRLDFRYDHSTGEVLSGNYSSLFVLSEGSVTQLIA